MNIPDKVTQYEYFLNEVLRTDLRTTLERRDEVFSEISQYMELQTVLEKLTEAYDGEDSHKLKTRVDIGCNFYVQAEIPNLKTILVDVGCGIWVPMNYKEALKFCENKLAVLNSKVEQLDAEQFSIKANIKIVLEGLREIQNIQFVEPKPRFED